MQPGVCGASHYAVRFATFGLRGFACVRSCAYVLRGANRSGWAQCAECRQHGERNCAGECAQALRRGRIDEYVLAIRRAAQRCDSQQFAAHHEHTTGRTDQRQSELRCERRREDHRQSGQQQQSFDAARLCRSRGEEGGCRDREFVGTRRGWRRVHQYVARYSHDRQSDHRRQRESHGIQGHAGQYHRSG